MFKKKGTYQSVKGFLEKYHGIPMEEFMAPEKNPEIPCLSEGVEFFKNYCQTHENPKIHIIGDYDADGTCASSILKLGFQKYGVEASVRIPKRFTEGYGLSEKIIDEINDEDCLIVTVDNGIAAIPAIKKAKEKGFSVIVTDHHLPSEDGVLPPADIIIDPWAYADAPYTSYCGAGIAYRFICELVPDKKHEELKVLAAIATVADLMQLPGANWLLVKEGLEILNNGKNIVPGLKQLIKKLEIERLTEEDFGFKLGPIFNAASRMEDEGAKDIVDILTAGYRDFTLPFKAKNLIENNERRKEITRKCLNEIGPIKERPIVIYNPDWKPGLIGLIAGHLSEQYKCPVIALTKRDKDTLTGSGRAPEDSIHLKETLDKCKKYLLGYGGHKEAAGLHLYEKDLESFKKEFCSIVGRPKKRRSQTYDLELNTFPISELVNEYKQFAPYGQGHPSPVLHMNYTFQKPSAKGSGENHLYDVIPGLNVIGFDMYETYKKMGSPKKMSLIGTLSLSYNEGGESVWFNILDMEERKEK